MHLLPEEVRRDLRQLTRLFPAQAGLLVVLLLPQVRPDYLVPPFQSDSQTEYRIRQHPFEIEASFRICLDIWHDDSGRPERVASIEAVLPQPAFLLRYLLPSREYARIEPWRCGAKYSFL